MKNFPQELVDQVIDGLFALTGRANCYGGYQEWFESDWITHDADWPVSGISDYSLVSKAWTGSAQKYHFGRIPLDSPTTLEKWRTHIAPDPAGVSRHVRMLVLNRCNTSDLEGFKEHMHAFTRVEYLNIDDCGDLLRFPSITQLFLLMGSCLTRLVVCKTQATARTFAFLLAALPLLQSVDTTDFKVPDDVDETSPPTPSRIPFFEGANRFVLQSNRLPDGYPEGSLDWIPTSARFSQLEVQTAYYLHNPGILNRWLTSSCATLTSLTIRKSEDGTSRPRPVAYQPTPLT